MPSKIKIIRAIQFVFLGLKLSNRPHPYKLYLNISNKCNFKCCNCPRINQLSGSREMQSEDAERILEEAYNIGCRLATISGPSGEVSIHPDFYHILKIAKKRGFNVNFTTNGWNIDPAKLSMLEPVDRIRISIDRMHLEGAPDPLAYISRLSSVIEECINLKLSVYVVIHGESTQEIDKMLNKMGVIVYNYPLITCSPVPNQSGNKSAFRCIDPWTSIYIQYDLTVNPCCRASESVGSITDRIKLSDVWFGKNLMSFRKMVASQNPPLICLSCDRSRRNFYQWCKTVYNNKSMI